MSVQINQPTRCINLSNLLLVVQIQLNMLRAFSCPSSGAYQLQPVVYCWNVVTGVLLIVVGPDRPRPTTLLPPRCKCKAEAATAVDKSVRTDHDQQYYYHYVPTVNQRRLLQLISRSGPTTTNNTATTTFQR